MKKALLLFFLVLLLIPWRASVSAAGCGVEPPAVPPVPPVGCRAMRHQCICDNTGQHCSWVWVCVRN